MKRMLVFGMLMMCLSVPPMLLSCDIGSLLSSGGGGSSGTTTTTGGTTTGGTTTGGTTTTTTVSGTEFGDDTLAWTLVGTGTSQCYDVVVQGDGKIVLAGYAVTAGNSHDFALVRYNSDGTLDTGFGSGGIVTTDFYGQSDQAWSVALQPDGKIVAAGTIYRKESDLTLDYVGVARYNADGSLDTTFGTEGTGKRYLTIGGILDLDLCRSVEVLSDGKILLGGTVLFASGTTGYDFMLIRLTSTGALDSTFGSSGYAVQDLGAKYEDLAIAMTVASDGRIALSGSRKKASSSNVDLAVAVFSSSGALDTTFNSTGYRVADVSSSDILAGLAFQSDGKLVAAGTTVSGSFNAIYACRLTAAGSLDASFASTGSLITGDASTTCVGRDVLVQSDGKIVVVGSIYNVTDTQYTFWVSRYTSAGALDTSFSGDGISANVIGGTDIEAWAADLAPDGAIIVAGSKDVGTIGYCFCAARIAP